MTARLPANLVGRSIASAALLLACVGCGAEWAASPATAQAVAVAALLKPLSKPADCRPDTARAIKLANEGDRYIKTDVDRAISYYTQAAELYPAEHRILWKLAVSYEFKEDWSQMVPVLTRATELAPHYATYWYKLGYAWIMLAEAGDRSAFERAKGPLKKCIETDPNLAECHNLLGEAYQWTDDDEAALVAYSDAIKRDPTKAYFYTPLADVYLARMLPQQAEQVLTEGVRLAPNNERNRAKLYSMHILLALVAQMRGDKKAQLRAVEAAEKYVDDLHPEFSFNLGSTYAVIDPPNKEKAIRLLSRFTKLVCRGSAAQKYKEQCEVAAQLMQRLGAPP